MSQGNECPTTTQSVLISFKLESRK